ncbi:hypothetical protein PHISCL_03062 [Aspergillus sclerotialis]|uniref:Uncharacterized protein n=1 Tax=Aspergillus sclerotialis TaxID=2070753 RepID=A0A3A2ZYY4_9EURO|nr:hypothetical protein PHISCL_03062 [Aspergillus sclerotialis]
MATLVSICVRAVLATVFTQYFWRLVRLSPMKLGTIETLYTLRGNPLWGLQPGILRDGFLLVMIAFIIWVVPIATSFSPSSMTLKSATYTHTKMMEVPTFNASDTWGGNISALQSNSLVIISANDGEGLMAFTPKMDGRYSKASVSQVALGTMVNGEVQSATSPCGATCSYRISIDAPYLSCNKNSTGKQAYIDDIILARDSYSHTLTADAAIPHNDTQWVYYTENVLLCTVQRATFEVLQNYTNNQLSSSAKLKSLHRFVDLGSGTYPLAGMTFDQWIHHLNGDLGPRVSNQIRDSSLMTLAQAMVSPLIGTYDVDSIFYGGPDTAGPLGRKCWWLYIDKEEGIHGYRNKSLVEYTPFFAGWRVDLSQSNYMARDLFNVSEPKLNSMLLNITLSVIGRYNLWSTPANVTQHENRQEYSFSRPLALILAYFLTLGVTLPFLVLGVWALRANGVPATDHSFLQILMTTRGSPTVDCLAAGGCLGGDHNVPRDLKELPVQFGELVGGDVGSSSGLRERTFTGKTDVQSDKGETPGRELRLASFGTLAEVTSLVRGRSYGVLHR